MVQKRTCWSIFCGCSRSEMWGTSKYLSESVKRIKKGQSVGSTLQDHVNWYLNSRCWSLLLLVQIPSSWLKSQPEAMTSAFETWKCQAWFGYLTAAHSGKPRIHTIASAWSWISWGFVLLFFSKSHIPKNLFFSWYLLGAIPPQCYMCPDQMHLSAAATRKLRKCMERCVFYCVTFDSKRKLERARANVWTNRGSSHKVNPRIVNFWTIDLCQELLLIMARVDGPEARGSLNLWTNLVGGFNMFQCVSMIFYFQSPFGMMAQLLDDLIIDLDDRWCSYVTYLKTVFHVGIRYEGQNESLISHWFVLWFLLFLPFFLQMQMHVMELWLQIVV